MFFYVPMLRLSPQLSRHKPEAPARKIAVPAWALRTQTQSLSEEKYCFCPFACHRHGQLQTRWPTRPAAANRTPACLYGLQNHRDGQNAKRHGSGQVGKVGPGICTRSSRPRSSQSGRRLPRVPLNCHLVCLSQKWLHLLLERRFAGVQNFLIASSSILLSMLQYHGSRRFVSLDRETNVAVDTAV
jgi:hypothetical protein